MAQTFVALVAPTTPVIRSDSEEMLKNMSAMDNFSRADLIAVIILGFVHAVKATRDYRSNHPQLIQDATTFMNGISNIEMNFMSQQMLLVFAASLWGLGYSKDPVTVPNPTGSSTDVQTVLAEARTLRCLPEETLGNILAYIQYVSATS